MGDEVRFGEGAPDAFPEIPDALMAALERAFPDRCPDGGLSNDDIRERIGETRVIRFLKRRWARQADGRRVFARDTLTKGAR